MFRRAGKWPLYVPADLDAWAQSKITGPLHKASAAQEGGERDKHASADDRHQDFQSPARPASEGNAR